MRTTKTLKPLPRPLRYLQPFVNTLARLGPEGHREQTIDAEPLNAALRKRMAGLDRRSAEAAAAEDRDLLKAWLNTTGGRDHPAYWVLGYLSSAGLTRFLRHPRPPQPKRTLKPKQPPRSAIGFEPPDGWKVKPGAWRLDLKAKGFAGFIEGMDEAEYDDALRLIKSIRPAPRPRGAPKEPITTTNIRRDGVSGKKHVKQWRTSAALSKQVHYMLRVPGGGVAIVLDGRGKKRTSTSRCWSRSCTRCACGDRLPRRGRPCDAPTIQVPARYIMDTCGLGCARLGMGRRLDRAFTRAVCIVGDRQHSRRPRTCDQSRARVLAHRSARGAARTAAARHVADACLGWHPGERLHPAHRLDVGAAAPGVHVVTVDALMRKDGVGYDDMIPLKYRSAALERPGSPRRAFELAALIWGVFTGMICYLYITPRLYLIARYGWARVRRDGLTVVEVDYEYMLERWTISNGDVLVWEHHEEILTLATWVPIMVVTVPVLWVVFGRGRRKSAGSGSGT